MTKLTVKNRDDVKALLEEHQQVTDALLNLGKKNFSSSLSVNNDDDSDYTTVELRYDIAKQCLTAQKKWLEEALAKLEIELV